MYCFIIGVCYTLPIKLYGNLISHVYGIRETCRIKEKVFGWVKTSFDWDVELMARV